MDPTLFLLAEAATPPDGLYDIVVPQPEKPLWPLLLSLLIALAFVAGAVALIVWMLRRGSGAAPALPPALRASRELDQLERQHDNMEPNRFGLALSDILKNYLADRFGDRVRYETAEEYLARLAKVGSTLPSAAQQELRDFLFAAEEVKFSYTPATAQATLPLLKRARNLLSLCESVSAPSSAAGGASAVSPLAPPREKR